MITSKGLKLYVDVANEYFSSDEARTNGREITETFIDNCSHLLRVDPSSEEEALKEIQRVLVEISN